VLLGSSPYQFPDTWQTTAFFSSFLLFMPGLLMIISITNEFSFKTHRQNIIDGWSRTEFILVKLMLVFIIAFISTIAVFITAFLFGIAIDGITHFSAAHIEYLFYFLYRL